MLLLSGLIKTNERRTAMEGKRMYELIETFLSAWNSQDVERVVACYTDDLVYRDPNTQGEVQGADSMRRYLKKLFSAWEMTWAMREMRPLHDEKGGAFLWRATFKRPNGKQVVEADGMDLALIEGERISRNEVYFDRAVLAPLLASPR